MTDKLYTKTLKLYETVREGILQFTKERNQVLDPEENAIYKSMCADLDHLRFKVIRDLESDSRIIKGLKQ